MSHWLEDAVMQGLTMLDVEEALAAQAAHFSLKGEWLKGVIAPSLVGVSCPLQRVKIFLGHTPIPNQTTVHMATKAGRPDPISLVNMVRGFDAEGLLVEALKRALPVEIIAAAPEFHVDWADPETGYHYAGHPDVLMLRGKYELIQIKCPSVFKMDRVEKKGDSDALETYLPQMATEMFIARHCGIPVSVNHLLLFSWEGTPKMSRPRVKVVSLDWDESLATIPETAAREIHEAAAKALMFNQWPKAFPVTSWDVWPCGYCRFARLGDFDVPACDDHDKWRSNEHISHPTSEGSATT